MKNIFVLLLSLVATTKSFSQVTFAHSFYVHGNYFYVTDIGNNNYKYVIQDMTGFTLYNLDYTTYLPHVTPPIPVWQPPAYYAASYITNSLFDCDSTNIEYVLTNGTRPSSYYIYRTDGTLLFQRDSVTGPYLGAFFDGSVYSQPIANTPEGTRLFLQDNKVVGIADSIYIYTLCGTLSESVHEMSPDNNFVQVFPNPTYEIINFRIKQPNNQDKFKLTIYNSAFQQIEEADIDGRNYQLDLKQKPLAPGTYLFDLRTESKVYQTGKFIVTK